MPQIHFNGKTYNDLAEMSAIEREMYDQLMSVMQDEDGNGVPDILEGDVVSNIIKVARKSGGDSEGIAALEQMSPAMRARISKGVTKLHELGLLAGIPDPPQEWQFSSSETTPSWEDAEIRPSKSVIQSQSAIQEDNNSRWLVVVILALASICLAGAVFFILRGGF